MSEEKFSKCEEGEKCKCKISGVRKKMEIERKVPGKKMMKIFKVFFGWFLKLKLRFAEKGKVKITVGNKVIAGVGLEPNPVWAPCCKTWLKEKSEI